MGVFARRTNAAAGHGPLEVAVQDNVRRADGSSAPTIHTGSSISQYEHIDDLKSPFTVTPKRDSFPSKASFSIDTTQQYEGSITEEEDEDFAYVPRRKWRSSRLAPGEVYEKPWKNEKIPRRNWEIWIFVTGCMVGVMIGTFLVYDAWISVTNSDYCNILIDDFQKGINLAVWNFEVQRGGFGTGTFEWTTYDQSNVYTDKEGLHIVPTLTLDTTEYTEAELYDNAVLNLTLQGICTSSEAADCQVRSNKTSGAIINPVRSARLNTKGKMGLKYGKVEVVAKLPKGDWLWPAIWMMPTDNVYGEWPRSGEIDIMEARGNAPPFPGGRNQVLSTLHWGPISFADGYWLTLGQTSKPRGDFSEKYHTYALEWSKDYLFTYVDSRLLQVIYTKFPKGTTLWDKGRFSTYTNQSALNNPWPRDVANAPFDQEFYLILNLAVGGTNGFFLDGVGDKPWIDKATAAQKAFWEARNSWLPTWGEGDTRGMTVKTVKMYTLGACADKAA